MRTQGHSPVTGSVESLYSDDMSENQSTRTLLDDLLDASSIASCSTPKRVVDGWQQTTSIENCLRSDSVRTRLQLWVNPPNGEITAEWLDDCLDAIASDIVRIDQLLEEQVNAILHHGRFKEFEASWRGLWWLHSKAIDSAELLHEQSESGTVVLRVLSVSKKELLRDFRRRGSFEYSSLFKMVYDLHYDAMGGDPIGLIVGDYEFTNHDDDLELLRSLSAVAAAAFVPFIGAAAMSVDRPELSLLGIEDAAELEQPGRLGEIYQKPSYAKWRSLRETEDARFIGLTCPRVLMRLPYENDGSTSAGFRFREHAEAEDRSRFLWGSSVYAFASVIIRAFATTGWFADIRGFERNIESGGIVSELPAHSYGTDPFGVADRFSTEVCITDPRERELSSLGFIPLSDCRDTEYSVFQTNQSIQQPAKYPDDLASTNARISSMLQYVLCASRFAHYLKQMMQREIGGEQSINGLQSKLSNWLNDYVYDDASATTEQKARRPLRQANVELVEDVESRGRFRIVMQLKPHYQLDDVLGEIRLYGK